MKTGLLGREDTHVILCALISILIHIFISILIHIYIYTHTHIYVVYMYGIWSVGDKECGRRWRRTAGTSHTVEWFTTIM
jgi:hypothetical protein